MEIRVKVAIEVEEVFIQKIQQYLEDTSFKYPDLVWSEGTGILTRMFYICGPESLVTTVIKQLKEYKRS